MGYLVGLIAAITVCLFATLVRLDRDRAFYPTLTIVVALYYVLFAAMAGSRQALLVEGAGVLVFASAAVVGFKRNLWIAAAAMFGHGCFDLVHHRLIVNPGVPAWWPAFCGTFDVAAAAWMACLLIRSNRIAARSAHAVM